MGLPEKCEDDSAEKIQQTQAQILASLPLN